MRTCSKCHEEKEDSSFHYRGDKKILHRECKKCALKRSINRRKKMKEEAIILLGGKCADCGIKYHRDVYDFHHINPANKLGDPGAMMQRSRKVFFEEISKCILLCANCHRQRHIEI